MRISYWSSDVCSSDLADEDRRDRIARRRHRVHAEEKGEGRDGLHAERERQQDRHAGQARQAGHRAEIEAQQDAEAEKRAEERRVGKEWGRTCRSRWSAYT